MNTQRGSVLILSLLILLVMTMLGITAMSTSTLEEKMAANDRNQKLAFQNAETALAQVETDVLNGSWMEDIKGVLASTSGYHPEGSANLNYFDQGTWQTDANCTPGTHTCNIIQVVDEQPPLEVGGYDQMNMRAAIFKITTMATDANGATRVLVQSTIEKNIAP